MTSVWNRLSKYLPRFSGRKLVGKDLDGNKYYEFPNPQGGRLRRVVKYRIMTQLSDYTSGRHRLPVQWTAWLSYTRDNPPSLTELQSDTSRQTRLAPLITAIEEREKQERIRQGYLRLEDPSTQVHAALGGRGIPGSGGGTRRINSTPSFVNRGQPQQPQIPAPASSPSSYSKTQSSQSSQMPEASESFGLGSASPQNQSYPAPTPTSSPAPPGNTVDPSRYDSKDDLRKLAEEDTKRRMAQTAELPKPDVPTRKAGVEGVGIGAGVLQPRRRGRG